MEKIDLGPVFQAIDETVASANWLWKWVVLPGLIVLIIIIIGGVIISTVN